MLRPRALTSALRKMNTGGIQSVMLFNPEGVLLAYTSLAGDSERSKAAIAANVWNIYQRQLESSESSLICVITCSLIALLMYNVMIPPIK
ncbi:unnamed protein product [Schistosoma margrebowiei]|uniref:Uncharacterized protein n=1 Tax=Schistosoma margrebowiei TaxID=48269 RepID=A0A183MTA8_9TREM|nr:unnamed protein product [Schistosoma margrebowiei]